MLKYISIHKKNRIYCAITTIVLLYKDAPIRNSADILITDKLRQILANSNNRSDIIIISVYYTVYVPQELQTACLDSFLTLKNSQIRDL